MPTPRPVQRCTAHPSSCLSSLNHNQQLSKQGPAGSKQQCNPPQPTSTSKPFSPGHPVAVTSIQHNQLLNLIQPSAIATNLRVTLTVPYPACHLFNKKFTNPIFILFASLAPVLFPSAVALSCPVPRLSCPRSPLFLGLPLPAVWPPASCFCFWFRCAFPAAANS
jgi:hypothetical protein